MMELVPVKRIERSHACTNAVELVISQLDRIEYNRLQRTLLLTDSLCTAPEREMPSPKLTM